MCPGLFLVMRVYVYIYIRIFVYIHAVVCIHFSPPLSLYIHTHIPMCDMYPFIHICKCVYIYTPIITKVKRVNKATSRTQSIIKPRLYQAGTPLTTGQKS